MKHFVDIDDFNIKELREILNHAKKIKKNQKSSLLKNKSLGLLFEKQSTRTRLSFSIGMQKIGGNVIELDANKVGFGTRETIDDLIKVMSQYLDVIMIRNDDHNLLRKLVKKNILPIINGLSNFSHPCQILSDIFTIEEKLGSIKRKKIIWIGDFNNVLTSLIQAAEIFEFQLNVITPKSLYIKNKSAIKDRLLRNTKFYHDIKIGVDNADCIMTDTWVSMGEKNHSYKKKLLSKFQVNALVMKKAKKNAIFMHCLPAHRNEEVTDQVIDGKNSIVLQQAQNRMFVQQGILFYLLNDV